jgi:branched-chain amino acid transport system substrate-binding protein
MSAARPLTAVLVAAALVAVIAGCGSGGSGSSGGSDSSAGSSGSGEEVKIGVVAGLTGYLSASSDVPFVEGVEQAAKTIDEEGGAAGHQINLSVVDDASNAGTGVTAANKLVAQEGVGVLMGGSLSAQCSGVSPVAVAHQIPMTCIAPPPETGDEYTFQVAAGLFPMVADEAGFAAGKLHAKRIAFLYSQTPYGQAAASVLEALAPKFGLEVISSQGVDPNSSDLSPLMAQVKGEGPEAVLDFLTGPVHIVEAKGAATAQLGVPLVQATDVTSVFKQSAAAYEDLYFVALPPQAYPSIPNADLKAANAKFSKAFSGNVDAIAQAAYGWDAVHIIAAAVEKSGAVTGPELREALEQLTYQGTLSLFEYSAEDHSGEEKVPNPNSIGQISGGKVKIVFDAEEGSGG